MIKSREIFHKKQDGLLEKANTEIRGFCNKNSIANTTFTKHWRKWQRKLASLDEYNKNSPKLQRQPFKTVLFHHTWISAPRFSFSPTKRILNRLQVTQNRAMRLILSFHWRTHIRTMLDNLEWQRIYMNTLVFIFKIKINMAPDYLASKLLYTIEATTRVLRNAVDFRLPRYNRTYTQNSLWDARLMPCPNDYMSCQTQTQYKPQNMDDRRKDIVKSVSFNTP
jgi:hypothetical protein